MRVLKPPSKAFEPVGELAATDGKADGVAYAVKDYFRNTANLDLSDLAEQTVNMGHAELNGILSSVPYTTIQVQPTQIFTNDGGEILGLSSSSLNALVDCRTYGSDAVTTEINQVRAAHLASSNQTLYAESEFSVALGGNFSFSTELGEGEGAVGFLPSTNLTARMVTAHGDNEINALPTQPLTVVNNQRGFVLPTSVDEISQMTPGESVTYLGVCRRASTSVPIFPCIHRPVSHLVFTARFHLGGRVLTEGELDIHLVRGERDKDY